jgi:predicted chitinase
MLKENLEELQLRIWNVFRKKYKVIQLAKNNEDKDYLIATFNAEWYANRFVNLIKEQEKDWKYQDHYIVKLGKEVVLYK